MKTTITLLLAGILASSGAHAWGKKEQGALIGAASVLIYQEATKEKEVIYDDNSVAYLSGNDEIQRAYRQGVQQREREKLEKLKQEAYQCGRYPDLCK